MADAHRADCAVEIAARALARYVARVQDELIGADIDAAEEENWRSWEGEASAVVSALKLQSRFRVMTSVAAGVN